MKYLIKRNVTSSSSNGRFFHPRTLENEYTTSYNVYMLTDFSSLTLKERGRISRFSTAEVITKLINVHSILHEFNIKTFEFDENLASGLIEASEAVVSDII